MGDFEVVRPTGATRCTYSADIWRRGMATLDHKRRLRANFTPPPTGAGVVVTKTENFYEISEYNRPVGAYLLHDFTKFSGSVWAFPPCVNI